MTLTEIRLELLQQHGGIRELVKATQAAIEQTRKAPRQGARELRTCLLYLDTALTAHNYREEELLAVEIRTVDAWGPVRAALMSDHHREEHDSMQRALADAADAVDVERAAAIAEETLRTLLSHMAAEEKEILAASVLRDDICLIDGMGG